MHSWLLAGLTGLVLTHARVTPTADHLALTLYAGSAIPADDVRVGTGAQGLVADVPNLQLDEPSRVMGDGTSLVVAQQRPDGHVLFTVPLPAGRSCGTPFAVTSSSAGLTVTATCRPAEEAAPSRAAGSSPGPALMGPPWPAELRTTAAPPLAATPVTPVTGTAPVARTAAPESDARVSDPLPLVPAAPPAAATAAPGAPLAVATPAPVEPTSSTFREVAALLFLAALTGVGVFAFRRRNGPGRLIQVMESTSLGPKRALLVVRVGPETLILGTSEAGIQLLATRPTADGVETRLEQLPEPVVPALHAVEEPDPIFEDFLSDSHEDSELRRRLAGGFPGRVA